MAELFDLIMTTNLSNTLKDSINRGFNTVLSDNSSLSYSIFQRWATDSPHIAFICFVLLF